MPGGRAGGRLAGVTNVVADEIECQKGVCYCQNERPMRWPPGKLPGMDRGEIGLGVDIGVMRAGILVKAIVSIAQQREGERSILLGMAEPRNHRFEQRAGRCRIVGVVFHRRQREGRRRAVGVHRQRGIRVIPPGRIVAIARRDPGQPCVGRRVVGIKREYLRVTLARASHRSATGIDEAAFEPRVGVSGCDPQRRVACDQRVAQTAGLAVLPGQRDQCFGVGWIGDKRVSHSRSVRSTAGGSASPARAGVQRAATGPTHRRAPCAPARHSRSIPRVSRRSCRTAGPLRSMECR